MTTKPSIFSPAVVALAAGFLVLFVGGGTRFSVGLTLHPMEVELGSGRGTLASAVALFLFVSAAFTFVSGRLSDLFSLRIVLGTGIAISALGIGLLSIVNETWQVLVLFGVLYAIGNGLANLTPVAVMVTRLFPGRAGIANAVAASGMSVGQLVTIAALATILLYVGWRSMYLWLAIAHLALLPLVLAAIPRTGQAGTTAGTAPLAGLTLPQAVRTRRFWLFVATYGICGFQDFFVTTHVVAFALDQGANTLFAGNLLALMGLTGLIGVIAAGYWSDRTGPAGPTMFCFVLRIAMFGLILVDQSPLTVALFALVFGLTFLMTAPLTVIFTRKAFGLIQLGTITGLVTMIHHVCGGLGAIMGGALFDLQGHYHLSFTIMAVASVLACITTWLLAAELRKDRPELVAQPA